MGTIIKKKVKGTNYYYYVEAKRIKGKSKYVKQKNNLGSADKLQKAASDTGKSIQEQVLYAHEVQSGSVALLYDIAVRLGLVDIIDSAAPKRNQGASVVMYILTAAINRAVSPTSRSGLKEWYEKTCLPYNQ